ncbi:Genomic scaffold, scaffold_5 (plasmid) [Desulfovibrio ferrophilus]|uniref:Genomic scaffold, scaffold_5 n=1 Tax=Desulfovibrio ferrophilus TaxID=241368 RepID=A0A2Z6B3X4_9BACT|nr:Genomic scaffold, scaffold_5 [Desulfovibrio ferrophilus]
MRDVIRGDENNIDIYTLFMILAWAIYDLSNQISCINAPPPGREVMVGAKKNHGPGPADKVQ